MIYFWFENSNEDNKSLDEIWFLEPKKTFWKTLHFQKKKAKKTKKIKKKTSFLLMSERFIDWFDHTLIVWTLNWIEFNSIWTEHIIGHNFNLSINLKSINSFVQIKTIFFWIWVLFSTPKSFNSWTLVWSTFDPN